MLNKVKEHGYATSILREKSKVASEWPAAVEEQINHRIKGTLD